MKTISFKNEKEENTIFYQEIEEDNIIIARYIISNEIAGIVLKGNSAEGFVIRHSTLSVWQKTIGSPKFEKLSDFLRFHAIEFTFQILE